MILPMTALPTQEQSNQLFRAYQNGSTVALGELYRRWHEYVTHRVKQSNTFPTSDIEDISANVWLLVQQNAHKWDVDRSSWFRFLDYRIRGCISEALTLQKRRHRLLEENGYIESSELSVFSSFDEESAGVNFNLHGEPLHNSRAVGSSLYVDPQPSALDLLIEYERKEILEKAIRVCDFAPVTELIFRLRLAGLSLAEIQRRLNLKQVSCVKVHLQRAIADIKEVINPNTYEVSSIAPKHRRKREKAEHLQRAGQALKQCVQLKSLTVEALSRSVRITIEDLEGYIQGRIKPRAARLNRLAAVLGEHVYDLYMPQLPRAKWAKQGQELWRARVKNGVSLKKVSDITGIPYTNLVQYEAGEMRMKPDTREKLSRLFGDNTP